MRIFIFLCLMLAQTAFAKVIEDDQGWINLNATKVLDNGYLLYGELQPRYVNHRHYQGVGMYRAAFGKQILPSLSVWAGYMYVDYTYPKTSFEHRLFGQLTHTHNFEKVTFINRTRIEDRHLHNRDNASYRFRHMLRAVYNPFDESCGFRLVAWDEWFWNANTLRAGEASNSPRPIEGFDQNRAFIGIGHVFGDDKKSIGEIGYMNQYVNGRANDSINHIIAGQVIWRIN